MRRRQPHRDIKCCRIDNPPKAFVRPDDRALHQRDPIHPSRKPGTQFGFGQIAPGLAQRDFGPGHRDRCLVDPRLCRGKRLLPRQHRLRCGRGGKLGRFHCEGRPRTPRRKVLLPVKGLLAQQDLLFGSSKIGFGQRKRRHGVGRSGARLAQVGFGKSQRLGRGGRVKAEEDLAFADGKAVAKALGHPHHRPRLPAAQVKRAARLDFAKSRHFGRQNRRHDHGHIRRHHPLDRRRAGANIGKAVAHGIRHDQNGQPKATQGKRPKQQTRQTSPKKAHCCLVFSWPKCSVITAARHQTMHFATDM